MSPDVASSRPATMRIVVVLPQPEGPSRTRNSRSRISRSRLATAITPPKLLVTPLNLTDAMASTLDRAEGEAAHEVLLHDEGEDHDGDAGHETGGADLAPVGGVLGDPAGDADRQGLRLRRQRQDERQQELVPGDDQAEDGGGGQARTGERQGDAQEGAPAGVAVDDGRLL